MSIPELKIPPLAVFLAFAAGMWLIPSGISMTDFFVSYRIAVVSVLSIVGGVLAVPAMFLFRRAHTTADPIKPEAAAAVFKYEFTCG